MKIDFDYKKVISRVEHSFKNLTQEQKKIIYATGALAALVLLFWFFVYVPQHKKLNQLKARLDSTEKQVAEITNIAKGKDLAQVIRDLKSDFTKTINRLPDQDEVAIFILSDSAKKLKIDVKSISPSVARTIEGAILGYQVMELPVTINLSGEYRALGEYLRMLRSSDFPIFVQVRQFSVKGNGEGQLFLGANLQISTYLAKKK